MKHNASIRAFTLIEILVVIAILGILMTMAVPAVNAISKRAKINTAKNDSQLVVTGLMKYRLKYNVWPSFAKGQDKQHFTDREFLETMMPAAKGAPPAENLNRVTFITGGSEDFIGPGKSGGQENRLIDPWGNPFQYLVNPEPGGIMELGSFRGDYDGEKDISADVLVWSAGPDGDYTTWSDNVVSWTEK